MALIKRDRAGPMARSALVLDLGDLDRQGREIIAAAEAEAAAIVAAAREAAQRLVDGADARGFAAGRERGIAEGRAAGEREGRAEAVRAHGESFETIAGSWTTALERWESELGALLLAAREEVLQFAVALARKVVLRVAETDPAVVEDQLAEVLALVGRSASVTVVINPRDRPAVERVLSGLLERFAGCRYAAVEDDAGMTRGGCVVRTAGGAVDATIETQLERIALALLAARPDAPDAPDGAPA